MKRYLVILALLFALPLIYLVSNHWDYGESLPPGLPTDIPIVDGQILSGRRTLFEDGMGYVVDIRSDLSYGEVLKFYVDVFGNLGLKEAPGMGADFSNADIQMGGKRILLEMHAVDSATIVTMAVHLGKWW